MKYIIINDNNIILILMCNINDNVCILLILNDNNYWY